MLEKIELTKEEVWQLFVRGFSYGQNKYGPSPLQEFEKELGFRIGSVENGHGGYTFLDIENFKKIFKPVDGQ